jgi:hypothetical protein
MRQQEELVQLNANTCHSIDYSKNSQFTYVDGVIDYDWLYNKVD